jgi:hypothetical protein
VEERSAATKKNDVCASSMMTTTLGMAASCDFQKCFATKRREVQLFRTKCRSKSSRARLLPSSVMPTDLALLFGSEM